MIKKHVGWLAGCAALLLLSGVLAGCAKTPSVSSPPPQPVPSGTVSPGFAQDGAFTDPTGTIRLQVPQGYILSEELSSETKTVFHSPDGLSTLSVSIEPPDDTVQKQNVLETKLSALYNQVSFDEFEVDVRDDVSIFYRYQFSTASSSGVKLNLFFYTVADAKRNVVLCLTEPESDPPSGAGILKDVYQSVQILPS